MRELFEKPPCSWEKSQVCRRMSVREVFGGYLRSRGSLHQLQTSPLGNIPCSHRLSAALAFLFTCWVDSCQEGNKEIALLFFGA